MTKEGAKRIFYGGVTIFFFALVISRAPQSREVLVLSAQNCFFTVIPAVFPCAVLGALIGTGVAEFPEFLKRAISFVFGVSREGAGALLAGLFAGFPVGASGASGLYARKRIDGDDLCRIAAFSATPGCAFVISGVGSGMFDSTRTGAVIYITVIAAVFLVGFLTKNGKNVRKDDFSDDRSFVLQTPTLFEALTESVMKSALAMLNLTAFLVFFSLLASFSSEIISAAKLPEAVGKILSGLLEVTLGCQSASGTAGRTGKLLAVIFCSFGGLSVQMQTLSVCAPCKVKGLAGRMFFLRSLITACAAVVFAVLGAAGLY